MLSTCKDAREAGFKAGKECYEAGFTYEEGRAAGFPSQINFNRTSCALSTFSHSTVQSWWSGCKSPSKNSNPGCPLPPRPPPPVEHRRGGHTVPPRVRPAHSKSFPLTTLPSHSRVRRQLRLEWELHSLKGLVDNRGAAHHAATTPQIAATIPRARRAPTPAGVEPPSSRDAGRGGGSDCRRCAGVPRVRAVSPTRIELSSTLAARALRPPARPPTSARRGGGRAVPPRVRPAPCVRPGAGVASPRCRDSHARSCTWRPRVVAQVRSEWEGKELRGWRRTMGPPGSLYLHLCRGARVAAARRRWPTWCR